jgi:CheY-like chemotaxis protein
MSDRFSLAGALIPLGTRVLIVEDQPFVAFAATDMIEGLGGIVTEVSASVEEGLDACARGDFDIALLDIDLDGRSSAPIAAALAAASKPFLLTTGFDGRKIPGFENVPLLVKPYIQSQLGRGLAALLPD